MLFGHMFSSECVFFDTFPRRKIGFPLNKDVCEGFTYTNSHKRLSFVMNVGTFGMNVGTFVMNVGTIAFRNVITIIFMIS
jgi:hypothetical protein